LYILKNLLICYINFMVKVSDNLSDIKKIFKDFKAAKFNFEIKAENDAFLPEYKGSTFRGVFGHIFKDIMCISHTGECNSCSFDKVCMFKKIFDSPPPTNSQKLRNYSAVPHPYVIEPPLDQKNFYKKDEIIRFSLILIGQAISLFPYFAYSFGLAGKKGIGRQKKGKFIITKIINDKDKELLYYYKNDELKSINDSYSIQDFIPENKDESFSVNLKFITPTRIMFNEKLVSKPEFHMFVRNTLRRISNLNYFHCLNQNVQSDNYINANNHAIENDLMSADFELDFNRYIEKSMSVISKKSLKWYSLDRYSNRQKTHMKLSGFIGDLSFEKVPFEYLWIIKLGELVHIGKNTTFGHGKYSITSIV
ncbi:MAG: CRISPR system precrRNA processing endoribonuclease RAMP protein Cas6, partial [Candidatus Acidulodesulfobacterium sp.]